MAILAFDTCLNVCSVAVKYFGQDGKPVTICHTQQMDRGHAEHLAPMIKAVMEEGGLTYPQIQRFAVTVGPGSFTGVRLGVALLRGMNISLQKPVVSTTSLHLLAHTFFLKASRNEQAEAQPGPLFPPVFVVQDARRGQFYVQPFLSLQEIAGTATPLPVEIIAKKHLQDFIKQALAKNAPPSKTSSRAYVIGSGTVEASKMMPEHDNSLEFITENPFPSASSLASIAQNMHTQSQSISPLYLRPADAKPQTGKKIRRQV